MKEFKAGKKIITDFVLDSDSEEKEEEHTDKTI